MRIALASALIALPAIAAAQAPAAAPLKAMDAGKQAVQAAPAAATDAAKGAAKDATQDATGAAKDAGQAAIGDAEPWITAKDGAVVSREWELGFSVYGMGNGSFMFEPDTADKEGLLYPGFGGASGGAGFNLMGSWRGIIGLEVGLMFSSERATGSIADMDFTVGQQALHVPVLLHFAIPLEKGVRPFVFGGPNFVFPGDAEVTEVDPGLARVTSTSGAPLTLNAQADNYMTWAVGVGFEFLMPIENQDFRIPLTLRANLNPNSEDKARDKLVAPVNGIDYTFKTEWDVQAMATLGFAWYFL